MSASPLPFHLINAFTTSSPHTGNQAAIVIFPSGNDPRSHDTEWMRLVARDFNYSETAYLVPLDVKDKDQSTVTVRFGLRWFTPEVEVPLCGHATLASAFTIFSLDPSANRIEFITKVSGTLVALRTPSGDVSISLPAIPSSPSEISSSYQETIINAIGLTSGEILEVTPYEFAGKSVIVQIDPNVDLASLTVDSRAIALVADGLSIITQANASTEISSRVFAPGLAVDEDSVIFLPTL
ncbi:phenazine biosynthesis PhzF protein [Naematelia encephala]|uniref:Phenazine biosynthesis PhzF protein n=1 Tax=Naematelia encephala TaxID=71784 RepID=A0A1Y2AEQ2_9TREE|nr:phenazine biosynthesis PhzF protein [Naematelia encephala]